MIENSEILTSAIHARICTLCVLYVSMLAVDPDTDYSNLKMNGTLLRM